MALNSTTKQAIEAFVDGIGTANPVSLNVDNLEFNRTISKKFAKMLSGVKKKQVTLANTDYTLTKEGAVSMVEMFDEGESLAPSYNESGALDINTDVNQPTVVLGGTFESKATTTQIVDGQEVQIPAPSTQVVTGKTVSIYDATFADHIYVVARSNEQVNLEGCIIDNRNGNLSTGKSSKNGGNKAGNDSNCAVNVSCNAKSVAMKDMVYYCSDNQGNQKMYNLIEITGGSTTKKIDIERCQFLGTANNNAVSIYDCADNAIINVKDCWFEDVSNVLRLSNTGNRSNVTINFENCVIEHWYGEDATSDKKNGYAGFSFCQDYTSKDQSGNLTVAAAEESNLYAPNKITINIKNCTGPHGPIKIGEGTDPVVAGEEYCQSGLGNQLCYVYLDANQQVVAYDVNRYPHITVSYDANAVRTLTKKSIPALQNA